MKKLFKIIGIFLLVIVVALAGAIGYAYWMLDEDNLAPNTEKFLAEALGTKVKLESAKLNVVNQTIAIYGFEINDRKDTVCLHVDTLEASLGLMPLLHHEVVVKNFKLAGAHAVFYKERKDTAANYQFIVDAFKFKSGKKNGEEKHSKATVMLDLRNISISRTSCRWDIRDREPRNTPDHRQLDLNHLWVDNVSLRLKLNGGGSPGNFVGTLETLSAMERNSQTAVSLRELSFDGRNGNSKIAELRCAYQDKTLRIADVTLTQESVTKDIHKSITGSHLNIGNISFKTDNGLPPKNAGNPNKGDFDPGHLDVDCSLAATCSYFSPDSISMSIDSIKGEDHTSGLRADRMSMSVTYNHKNCEVHDLKVAFLHTKVNIPYIHVDLQQYGKNKKDWKLSAPNVSVDVLLKDIARPFAKALSNFTTPLHVSTSMTATAKRLDFSDIRVRNNNSQLTIAADGYIMLGRKKEGTKTYLEFDVHRMQASSHLKDVIISHFVTKPKLKHLLAQAGNITYSGKVIIPYRKQVFKGRLGTSIGALKADVTLNSETRYASGKVSSDSIDLKRFTGNKNLGKLAFNAEFSFDICGKAMARKLHRKWGKLPAGYLRGEAYEASYKFVKLRDIKFNIVSDATTARGTLATKSNVMDVSADFSFESCDFKHSLKVKPHIKMNKISSWFKKKKKDDQGKK